MRNFLILKAQGSMQAWGGHTFEAFRPSHIFPTRSGVVGLLGACLGIDRKDIQKREDLNSSFELTIRAENRKIKKEGYGEERIEALRMKKITDFHTALDARRSDGKARKEAVVSLREYLCDAEFSIILDFKKEAVYGLKAVKRAVCEPVFAPFLGRRSCPLHRPLFEKIISASDIKQVLKILSEDSETAESAKSKSLRESGAVYSENKNLGGAVMRVRDAPVKDPVRKFYSRTVYIQGGGYVS